MIPTTGSCRDWKKPNNIFIPKILYLQIIYTKNIVNIEIGCIRWLEENGLKYTGIKKSIDQSSGEKRGGQYMGIDEFGSEMMKKLDRRESPLLRTVFLLS